MVSAMKRKHYTVLVGNKYEAPIELENLNSSNDVEMEFNMLQSTLSTWEESKWKNFETFKSTLLYHQWVKVGTFEEINQASFK